MTERDVILHIVGLLLAPRGIRATRLERLLAHADLSELARDAVAHGVDAFVLSEFAADPDLQAWMAADAIRSLQARQMREAGNRQQRLVAPLQQVLETCATVGARAVCLKGPMLAARLLGDARARDSNDLDVMIAPADYPAVMRALLADGWRTDDSPDAPPPVRTQPHATLARGSTVLELHVTPGTEFGIEWPVNALMARAQALPPRFSAGGGLVLEPADEFVYLAAHGLKHQFRRAQWLLDLALLARTIPDVAVVEQRGRELGATQVERCARSIITATLGSHALPAGWGVRPTLRFDLVRWLMRMHPAGNARRADVSGGIARKLLQMLLATGAGAEWRAVRSIGARIHQRIREARQ